MDRSFSCQNPPLLIVCAFSSLPISLHQGFLHCKASVTITNVSQHLSSFTSVTLALTTLVLRLVHYNYLPSFASLPAPLKTLNFFPYPEDSVQAQSLISNDLDFSILKNTLGCSPSFSSSMIQLLRAQWTSVVLVSNLNSLYGLWKAHDHT